MRTRTRILITLVLLGMLLGPCAPAAMESLRGTAAERAPVTVRQMNDVPSNAVQILYNGDFEAEPPDDGWSFDNEQSGIAEPGAFGSDYCLSQGHVDGAWTTAIHSLEGVDFSRYDEPIWLSRCHNVFTWEYTLVDTWDISEGSFYTDAGMSVAYMWLLSNLDHTGFWQEEGCYTYRIEGLTTWGDQLVLKLATMNNSNTYPTTFRYDNFSIWGVPKFKVYLPMVLR